MPVIFNMKMKQAGMTLFDRNVIKTNWSRINRDPMQKAGNKVRMKARGLIRRRTRSKQKGRNKPSPPGTAPRSWIPGKGAPFKMIFNMPYGRMGVGQIVGMVGFSASGQPVPELHEYGGFAKRRVFVKGPQRRTKKGRYGRRMMVPVTKTVRYPKRPFMQPGLELAKSELPKFWRESITKSRAA